MAAPSTALNLSGLAGRLVRAELLGRDVVESIHRKAVENRRSFYAEALNSNRLEAGVLARAASEEFGLPLVDISALDLDAAPIKTVSEKLINRHRILPLHKRGTKLFVAVGDPTDLRALDEIKFNTGLGVEAVLVDDRKLDLAIQNALEAHDTTFQDFANEDSLEDIDISSEEDDGSPRHTADVEQIDAPIVRFVNKILLDAISRGASDIHIEPYERNFRIRYRIDGVLYQVAAPPVTLAGRIAARVKILSRLDIAERRVPQDGRMKLRLSRNKSVDFRISTLPTLYGEKVVLRLLDGSGAGLGMENLGFEDDQIALYRDAISRPYGMILVTGPTGSGKTITLYTALGELNDPRRNVTTVEDPVEINLPGVNQTSINERANLGFATALRAFLRQDPDVIMVGEIRDLETADIAVKASQTGHLVLSTLHTNDAPATLTRLLNMGVAPFNVASAVHLIIAQRLARKLCGYCRAPLDVPKPALLHAGFKEEEITEELRIFGPVGCENCVEGYKGRTGIFQVMPLSEEMGRLIMEGCNQNDIEEQARKEGVLNLRQAGLLKVRAGKTSLAEVERVTNL